MSIYAVRDRHLTVASAVDEAAAIATLRALVATAPGREDDIVVVELDASGAPLGPARDVFDLAS
jgi:hypothetical protein